VTLRHLLEVMFFGYPSPPEMINPHLPSLLQRAGGLLLTFLIAFFSLSIGTAIGLVIALCRRDPAEGSPADILQSPVRSVIRRAAAIVVETIRGLPILLLVLLVFYLPYPLFGLRLPAFVLAVAAFSLYAGVYLSEIIRAGFRSVDHRFRNVGRVLGLSPLQIFLKLELPLLFRNMLPDLISLTVTVFKDTSTLAVVAVPELCYVLRQMLMSEPARYQLASVLVLMLYWLPTFGLSLLAVWAERWRNRSGETWFRKGVSQVIGFGEPEALM
jgi:His/Glu/Gln/Arg/opine family amino acid ABC transporter permease subunit